MQKRKSLKIGLVIYGSLDILTGGFLYDKKLVNHFQADGHEVRVFSLPWRSYKSHLADNFNNDFLSSLSSADLDILIQDELNHPSLVWLNRKLKRKVRYPVISVVHHLRRSELRPKVINNMYGLVEKSYLSSIDGMIYNSRTTRKVVESLELTAKPSVVAFPGRDDIRHGVDEAFIAARAGESGPLRVLFVGSVIPRKELHTLIWALSRLPRQAWMLDIVGSFDVDRKYSGLVMKLIRDKGLEGSIRILGSLEPADLAGRYMESHALAVPSSYEGFGIVYLEAMGFGVPSIASNTGAAHEIVTHDSNGFLVQPGDVNAIHAALKTLHEDRAGLARMGVAALDRYLVHPTWEQSAQKALDFVKEMVR